MSQRTFSRSVATLVLAALGSAVAILAVAMGTSLGLNEDAAYFLAAMIAGGAIGIVMRPNSPA